MKIISKPHFKLVTNCDKGCDRKYECSYCGHDCRNDCGCDNSKE